MSLTTLLTSDRIAAIDFKMAESILDRLGYSIDDLSLDNGDVAIPDGEITHILHYVSIDSTYNTMGYIRCENGIYYVSGNFNYATYQQACLELLNPSIVHECRYTLDLERAMAVDYD